jgi:hypothetical protein
MYGRVSSPFLNKIKLFRGQGLLRATHLAINPGLCGGFHLRVILVLLSNYLGLHTWLSTQDLCGGFHLGVILTLKVYKGLQKCFDLENIG